jgi:hypothetical protein
VVETAGEELSPAVKEVIDLLPPTRVFARAINWMVLELRDRRCEDRVLEHEERDGNQETLLRGLHERRLRVTALGYLLALAGIRCVLWLFSVIGLLEKKYYRLVTASQARTVKTIVDVTGTEAKAEMTVDEREAEAQIEEYVALVDRLKEAYGVDSERICAYLLAHRSAAMKVGQDLAKAERMLRRSIAHAERDANLFKTNVTFFGAIVSLAAFVKQLAVLLIVGLGIYWLAPVLRGEKAGELSEQARTMSAFVAAMIALALTWMRLFFNFRRMTKVERDSNRRSAEARLVFYKERLRVTVEAWDEIADAYRTLTGQEPTQDALAAQEQRIAVLNERIRAESAIVDRYTARLTTQEKLRQFVDGGLGQGDIGDAL